MTILILGASGLIGHDVASHLARKGRDVVAVARGWKAPPPPGARPVSLPVVDADDAALDALLEDASPTLVLNCVGVLQDGPQGGTQSVHVAFLRRLVAACERRAEPPVLVHLSIPGASEHDETAFARTKRMGEAVIAGSALRHAILRPGFVVAPGAYGGSALVRAVAATPLTLPPRELDRPFMAIASSDIARTVAYLVDNPPEMAIYDLVHPVPTTLGDVVEAHRDWLGGPRARFAVPGWVTPIGAWAADLAGRLGWRPPTRSTALAELRRGIAGDPERWIANTGIRPLALNEALAERPATVADRWFARLYPLKALALVTLVAFWVGSGMIALASFGEARAILLGAGFPMMVATFVTWTSSLMDIVVGALVAHRRTARVGLWAGIAVSLFYMAGAAVLTPAMWLEPLGALVKTFPAIVLMLACLATLDDR